MNTPLPNDVDLAEYVYLVGRCADRLAMLTAWVDDHGGIAPDAVNRGDCERMMHICNLLGNAEAYVDLIDQLNAKRFAEPEP